MHCPACGASIPAAGRICLSCGEVVRAKVASAERLVGVPAGVPGWIGLEPRPAAERIVYPAARLSRLMALLVDGLVLAAVAWGLGHLLGSPAATFHQRPDGTLEHAFNFRVLIPLAAAQAAYWIVFPATSWHGTAGKRFLGLEILTVDDQSISIFQSAMRFFFQQVWLWIGFPLAVYGASNSPWAAFPSVGAMAAAIAFWVLCGDGRSPWDWMAGTKVVD